jgi:hypothetical protein
MYFVVCNLDIGLAILNVNLSFYNIFCLLFTFFNKKTCCHETRESLKINLQNKKTAVTVFL